MTQRLLQPRAAPTVRYYQQDALDALHDGIRVGAHSQLVVMATGLGKSVLFGALIREFEGSVLVIAHRDELISQAARHIEAATGEQVEIEQAREESWKARIVVGSVQSVSRPGRLNRLGKERFALMVIDEFHHAIATSYRTVMDWFECPIIGLTATPDRGDEKALGRIVDRVSFSMDIQEGIEQGWLVPIRGTRVQLDKIQLDGVKKTAGDLAVHELDEIMVESVEGIVHETLRLAPDRQGIAFFPGVRSAELAAARFNTHRSNMACFVSGETPPDDRKQTIADFRRGRYQILCNCQVATEGFDVPEASLIVQGRPTLSRALYAQMIGRGTRPDPRAVAEWPAREQAEARRAAIAGSGKPDCLILDMVGNSTRHSLMGPEDVLGGNFAPDVIERAKKAARKGADVLRALKEAQQEIQSALAQAKAKVESRVTPFDPFAIFGVDVTEEERYAVRFGTKPATEAQVAVLKQKGVDAKDLDGLSKMAAHKLLDELALRQRKGLATYKQCRQLEKFGIMAKEVSFERARQGLDYIAGQGWGRRGLDPAKLTRIVFAERQPGEEG